jgi:hypothetical protein
MGECPTSHGGSHFARRRFRALRRFHFGRFEIAKPPAARLWASPVSALPCTFRFGSIPNSQMGLPSRGSWLSRPVFSQQGLGVYRPSSYSETRLQVLVTLIFDETNW